LDFTLWLAEEDSLAILGETLGMDLVLESSEVRVGSFSADIVCVNTDDNSRVLIENQLEKTDHKHLGQLLTYSAGLNTVSIVWISSQFTDEHRASLDWLNEITDEKFRFFGLEVELWRIGDSNLAPRFNIVSKPNEWSRTLAKKGQRQTQTPIKELQQEFWQSLKEYGGSKNSKLRFQTHSTQHWYNFGIGKTDTKLVALVNSKTKTVTIGFESFGETGTYYFTNFMTIKCRLKLN
jgi:hypothetical protein